MSPTRTMTSLRWLYVVLMPSACVTSTRLPPHTSQKTAVTVPSRAATTGVPSGTEMSVPLWKSFCLVSGAIRHPKRPPSSTTTGWAGAMMVLTGSSPSKVAGARVLGATGDVSPAPLPEPLEPEPLPDPAAPAPPAPEARGPEPPGAISTALRTNVPGAVTGTSWDAAIAAWSGTTANREA